MINLSTESSTVENSKENSTLPSKQYRGKVRLPPISTRQLTRHIPQQKPKMQTRREGSAHGSRSSSSTFSSSFNTENLLTPTVDYKCPRSPSNLSLQFNFEEHPDTGSSKGNENRVKSGRNPDKKIPPKTPRSGKSVKAKLKGYHVLNTEEPATSVENVSITTRERRISTISGTSTVTKAASSRNNWTKPRGSSTKPSTETGLRVGRASGKERKGSTYDLREFLSLPTNKEHKMNAMSSVKSRDPNGNAKLAQYGKKKPVKIPLKPTLSDESRYDVFEFLALSAESSKRLTDAEQNKLTARQQKGAKVSGAKLTKSEIPSVFVADWSLTDETPSTKQVVRPSRELPKANFPREDFPKDSKRHATVEPPKKARERNSIYNLKEFLTLPDVARLRSIQKVSPQSHETKPQSNSLETDSAREPDVKYDLDEFLNFLESGGDSLQVIAPGREQATGTLGNRSLSVYNIYEFLKATHPKELSASVEGTNEATSSPFMDVTKLVAKSSPSSQVKYMLPIASEENAAQASCYDLREFLTLPVTMESKQNESKTNRTANERLRTN